MRRVAAAVIVEDGRLFLARRPIGDSLAGMWELPGGKIEPGETPQGCIERELVEELQMRSTAGDAIASVIYQYDHGIIELIAVPAVRDSGFELRFHDACTWAAAEELDRLAIAPADLKLLRTVRRGSASTLPPADCATSAPSTTVPTLPRGTVE